VESRLDSRNDPGIHQSDGTAGGIAWAGLALGRRENHIRAVSAKFILHLAPGIAVDVQQQRSHRRTQRQRRCKQQTDHHHRAAAAGKELDLIDRRILRALQADGRLSNAALANRVHLSPAGCWTRTRRLFESGVIRAVRALIDPAALHQETIVLVGVVLDRSTRDSFAAFENAVRGLPQILECFLVAGEVDYFLKVRVRDLADFNRFHGEIIIALPGVRQVRTFFVLNEVKADGPLPV
jgi:Lrp/AsnC family leucine-responsive transcriptional regulator